jgi:hypothetical protein
MQAELSGAPAEKLGLGDDIKGRYVKLGAPLPNSQRKIGADPGGFAERQCQGLHKSLLQHETRTENRLVHQ